SLLTPSSLGIYLKRVSHSRIRFFREVLFFFFNDRATTEIYTLSLHDALPICCWSVVTNRMHRPMAQPPSSNTRARASPDRKSPRLHSRHSSVSSAVFCLK